MSLMRVSISAQGLKALETWSQLSHCGLDSTSQRQAVLIKADGFSLGFQERERERERVRERERERVCVCKRKCRHLLSELKL